MLSVRGIIRTCPKTGKTVSLTTEYSNPQQSLNDTITKSDLDCGKECDFDPCPIVEEHNVIY